MKLRISMCTVLVLALVLVPVAASAATFQGSGTSASAWGEVYEPGAERPSVAVNIYAGESVSKSHVERGKPEAYRQNGVFLSIDYPVFSADSSPADGWTTVWFELVPYDAGIDRYLTQASVHATVEGVRQVYDWEPCPDEPGCYEGVVAFEEPVTAEVDFDWIGIGDLQRYRSMYRDWTPSFRWTDHTSGKYRDATVVGSVVVDGVDLIEGIELAGAIDDSKYHSVQLGMLP